MEQKPIVHGEKGVAAIEFALVLPVLLLLLIGIIEFSILLYDKAMITNASREGARVGILYNEGVNMTDTAITDVVNNYTATNLISFGEGANPPTTTIDRDNTNGDEILYNSGDTLTVTVTYNYDFLVLPSFMSKLSDLFTLRATTIMRFE
jgi:Flp pilus assembly protein TadG